MKIKILQLLINSGSNMGGVEQCAINYSKINDLSPNIEIITLIPNKNTSYKGRISGKVKELSIKNKISFLFKIFCIILKEKPKFFIFHSSRGIKFVKFLSLFLNIKIIGVNHGFNMKKFTKRADIIFCINSSQLNEIKDKAKGLCMLVPNFTEVKNNTIDKEIKNSNEIIIGTLSRIDFEYKNLDKIVKAAEILKKDGFKFKFYIGGDFGEIKKLKKMVSDSNLDQEFVYKGLITDKIKFFSEIDIFCMPSKNETFGISYFEAMDNMVPTIATNNDGARDIFTNNKTGILIEKSNPDRIPQLIADSVKFLAQNPQKYKEISQNAYKSVQNDYSLEAMNRVFEKLIMSRGS